MGPVRGIVDGVMREDKRTYILPSVLIRYYQHTIAKWDDITDVRARTGDKYETITVRLGKYRHTWRFEGGRGKRHGWKLVKEEYVR